MASKGRLGPSGHGIRRTGSFAGKAVDTGIVIDLFLATQTTSTALKKPGIPADTPAWLRTNMEIMLGRRGNAIAVPAEKALTFSGSPTQAECEALYDYTNSVRDTLEELIRRFDT